MTKHEDDPVSSYEPQTIWALNESDRPAAVIARINACARQYREAVRKDDVSTAQELAIIALTSVAGLFPNPNGEAHVLLSSLNGMLMAAKSGRTGHFLMRTGQPIVGMTRGFGHAYLGGFAVSAVEVLIARQSLSARRACDKVAKLLANAGCSLRKGDHDLPKPITAGAIRNWRDHPADFPGQHEIALEMASTHSVNLTRRSAETLTEILDYFQDQAFEAVQHARIL